MKSNKKVSTVEKFHKLVSKIVTTKKFHQLVLFEGKQTNPWVERIESDQEITLDKVWEYAMSKHDFTGDECGITFLDDPEVTEFPDNVVFV